MSLPATWQVQNYCKKYFTILAYVELSGTGTGSVRHLLATQFQLCKCSLWPTGGEYKIWIFSKKFTMVVDVVLDRQLVRCNWCRTLLHFLAVNKLPAFSPHTCLHCFTTGGVAAGNASGHYKSDCSAWCNQLACGPMLPHHFENGLSCWHRLIQVILVKRLLNDWCCSYRKACACRTLAFYWHIKHTDGHLCIMLNYTNLKAQYTFHAFTRQHRWNAASMNNETKCRSIAFAHTKQVHKTLPDVEVTEWHCAAVFNSWQIPWHSDR